MPINGGSTFAQASAGGVGGRSYEFGPYRVEVPHQRLLRDGAPIPITPKTFDLLLLLLRHRDRVVGKAELMRELWPDTNVEEANLTQQIFTLRRILGDTGEGLACIETIPRRGYRFVADVREASESEGERAASGGPALEIAGRRPGRTAVIVAAALLSSAAGVFIAVSSRRAGTPAGPVVLAVLPLQLPAGSAARDDDAPGRQFADALAIGIPDAIITRLSGVRQFRVRPTSAVAQYRGGAVDIREVGRRLASQYVLAGTVRTAGDRVRVSVQLVRTSDGTPIWGDTYDRARDDLLSIEDGIAEAIADTLRLRISDADRERLYRRYMQSGAAYERYLMGRARLRAVTEQDALHAIAEFEAARALDPEYAPAYAGVATAAAQLRVRFASQKGYEVWDTRARREAGRALQIDPDLAEAHVALAAVHRFQGYDWDTVIRESRRALELSPSLDTAHLYLAAAYFHLGLLDEAAGEVEAARELNPENRVEPLEILGAVSLFAGRPAEAARHLSQVQDISDSRIVRYLLGWTLYYEGEPQRGEALLASMIDEEGPLSANARATLAALLAARGATADARALARRVAGEADLIHHAAYGLGAAHAQLGDTTSALRWLSQAVTTGFRCYPWYQRDPLLDPLRRDERFVAFMADLRRSTDDARARYAAAP